jgi:hypothetical protein
MVPPEMLPGFLLAFVYTPLAVVILAYVGVRIFVAYLDRQQPPAE